jgi:acetyl esterase/lipase
MAYSFRRFVSRKKHNMAYRYFLSVTGSLVVATAALHVTAAPRVESDVEYARVADTALKLDLYLPENAASAPLLVYVHGGAWEAGSKAGMPLGWLVERGYAVASLDFRPASKAPFPGQVHEIKAAVRFLRGSTKKYGYDASRIAIVGVSSGGHLAAMVGTSNGDQELEGTLGDHKAESSSVQAIISYFGAANLTTILAQSTPFGLGVREPALVRLLGALPKDNEAAAREASPVFHVDARDPPLLMLHGDQDPQMPINQSHELEGAYEKQGLPVDFIVVHGAAHGGDGFDAPDNRDHVAAFLDKHLRR